MAGDGDDRDITPQGAETRRGLNRRATLPTATTDDSLVALVTAIRWAVAGGGLLWAIALRLSALDLVVGLALLAYALFRTYRPVEYRRNGWRSLWAILGELSVCLAAVVTTGCWLSPYIFSLFTPVIAAGFAQGLWHAVRIAVTATATVAIASVLLDEPTGLRPVVTWAGELALVGVIASYGRRLLHRAEQAGALSMSQLWQLNEANALLVSLNRLSRDLPASFDFQETIRSALARVDDVTAPDVSALLLLDPVSGNWTVTLAEGTRLPDSFSTERLPEVVAGAVSSDRPRHVRDLSPDHPGLSPSSRSGLYIPLRTAERRVGIIAVEATEVDRFDDVPIDEIRELAQPLALTIDNARWFDRLRARGAAQERTRIARDLHDRVGQGVAYVAFELDRLASRAQGTGLAEDLEKLRADARSIVGELRETLYDLRTDVSDERSISDTMDEFLTRVESRSGVHTRFEHHGSRRLPLAQESEVWRIAQEAILNAERHARATNIDVSLIVDEEAAILTVADDGVGLGGDGDAAEPSGAYSVSATPGRPAYGVTGMRERAEAIGGLLEMNENQPSGTIVRLTIGDRRPATPRKATVGGPESDKGT